MKDFFARYSCYVAISRHQSHQIIFLLLVPTNKKVLREFSFEEVAGNRSNIARALEPVDLFLKTAQSKRSDARNS